MDRFTPLAVKHAKPGRHGDGKGLYLLVKDSGARSWMLRVQADGKRRDLGLGTAETKPRDKEGAEAAAAIPLINRRSLTLAEARAKADVYREMVKAGIDPIAESKKVKGASVTFEAAARSCHASLKAGWKNKKHTDSWLACLETYAFPSFGRRSVASIDGIAVRDMLAPIWLSIPETARRVLQRTGAVLDFAHIKGWRATEASLRSVRKGLPKQPSADNHFEAMPYELVPAFYQAQSAKAQTMGRDALRFTILTAVRSGETRLALRSEFDLRKGVWTIPSSRMKMKEVHQVPLTAAAIAIVRPLCEVCESTDSYVFSANGKTGISDATMLKVLRDDNYPALTVHGFRSSFTDWAAETTEYPKEVVDKALAHKLPDKVEAAYRRTDFFEKRRSLMAEWANFLTESIEDAANE